MQHEYTVVATQLQFWRAGKGKKVGGETHPYILIGDSVEAFIFIKLRLNWSFACRQSGGKHWTVCLHVNKNNKNWGHFSLCLVWWSLWGWKWWGENWFFMHANSVTQLAPQISLTKSSFLVSCNPSLPLFNLSFWTQLSQRAHFHCRFPDEEGELVSQVPTPKKWWFFCSILPWP